MAHMTDDFNEIQGKYFDYIIVGGGASGCPLAATLSEKYLVLVVERGDSPYGNSQIEDVINDSYSLMETDEFTSVAQKFISEEGLTSFRGRVLGGTTSINGGFYSRARKEYIEEMGWDEKLVEDAYKWVESKIVFNANPMLRFQSTIDTGTQPHDGYGLEGAECGESKGMCKVEPLRPLQSAMGNAFLEAGIRPFNGYSLEHIEGTKVGATIFDENGKRHSSADLLSAGDPKKITVLLKATVKSILFHTDQPYFGGGGQKPRAKGINFIHSQGNSEKEYQAYLTMDKGDVILSAGTLGSPQLLMLSGIGPKEQLQQFKIESVVDLVSVGVGFQDNPGIDYILQTPPKFLPDPPQVVGITNNYRTMIQPVGVLNEDRTGKTIIVSKVFNPQSRGYIKLKSTDPRQNPSVTYNFLATEGDLQGCVKNAHLIEKVAFTESLYSFTRIKQRGFIRDGSSTDEELRDYCTKNVSPFYHYHGGCEIGQVIDDQHRVHGVERLRVVDGSTLRNTPGTNPMATVLMLGRYQGKMILKERDSEADENSA